MQDKSQIFAQPIESQRETDDRSGEQLLKHQSRRVLK